ncbi:uncharacterized protein N7518_007472 [Penicillium psychrosexuale]|uniref:uncharacterized protein n=1 Tax=Penicillium psychrosexuale TaxID=1002107 RepID=UPI0025459DAF|nr:uncharacterized protein N7518_007472 [Penicillium psychrosexuale]KAJ5790461.1 hypothetical protein N7518_007472 [Penicillium psychrosexuale]
MAVGGNPCLYSYALGNEARSPNRCGALSGYPPAAVQRTWSCDHTVSVLERHISIQTGLFQMLYNNGIGYGSVVIGQQLEIPLNLSTRSATSPGVSAELSVDTACVLVVVALELRQAISSSSPMASAELCHDCSGLAPLRRKNGNGLSLVRVYQTTVLEDIVVFAYRHRRDRAACAL